MRGLGTATLLMVLLLLIASSVGCVRVKPWEKDALARDDMQFDPDSQRTAIQGHIQFSKEGSMPGTTAGGGGCGCN